MIYLFANQYHYVLFVADIVFFIFLYQRWMYKVDKSRVNEFGFSGDMEEDSKKQLLPADAATTGQEADNSVSTQTSEKKTN